MKIDSTDVCPAKYSGMLDNMLRRLIQNPNKILKPYIKEGMSVADIGCGPGFFTVEIAKMVGPNGKVIASDLQEAMLAKVAKKIKNTELESRVTLHKCEGTKVGIKEKVDFVLAFYMIHEVPDCKGLIKEMHDALNPNGKMLIVEPIFNVSAKSFALTVENAVRAGFETVEQSKSFGNRIVVLGK